MLGKLLHNSTGSTGELEGCPKEVVAELEAPTDTIDHSTFAREQLAINRLIRMRIKKKLLPLVLTKEVLLLENFVTTSEDCGKQLEQVLLDLVG